MCYIRLAGSSGTCLRLGESHTLLIHHLRVLFPGDLASHSQCMVVLLLCVLAGPPVIRFQVRQYVKFRLGCVQGPSRPLLQRDHVFQWRLLHASVCVCW